MRRVTLAVAAALSLLAAGSLTPRGAEAMTLPTPAGIKLAIDETSLAQNVHACRRVWRCGRYGCGWRRVCWRAGPRYYYGGPVWYGPRFYYGRPYWRHRYWHRRWR